MATGVLQRKDVMLASFIRLSDKGPLNIFEIEADRAAHTPFRIRRFLLVCRDGTGRIVRLEALLRHVKLLETTSEQLGEGPSVAEDGAPEAWLACAPSTLFLPGDRIRLELSRAVDPARCTLGLELTA